MAGNFLEQLVGEWYEYSGYFVRRNILVGPREKGGYECELDVVAFHPETRHLVHVEPSMDADSWAVREARYKKKFAAGRRHIPAIFKGLGKLSRPEQFALLVFASKKNRTTVGGGQIMLVSELLEQIFSRLKNTSVGSSAVPEHLPVLRTLQFAAEHHGAIAGVLGPEVSSVSS